MVRRWSISAAFAPMTRYHRGELARRVLSIVEGDGFGSSGATIRHLSEALGPSGRAEIQAATKKALAAVPKSEAADRWQVDERRRHLAHTLALLADIAGDVDDYISAMREGGMEAAYAPDIANKLIRAGRPGEAIGGSSDKMAVR